MSQRESPTVPTCYPTLKCEIIMPYLTPKNCLFLAPYVPTLWFTIYGITVWSHFVPVVAALLLLCVCCKHSLRSEIHTQICYSILFTFCSRQCGLTSRTAFALIIARTNYFVGKNYVLVNMAYHQTSCTLFGLST